MTSIEVKNLTGGYNNQTVLKNISLTVEKSKFTAIAGPNGCGKSTLLKYLIRELKASYGKIYINNCDINSYTRKNLSLEVSYSGQIEKPEYPFTVSKTVMLGRFAHNDKSKEQALKAMQLTGITDISNKYITEISGGQYQLVMLSRAICQETEILLLDEPFNNLDPTHQIKMLEVIKNLTQTGHTVVCVMHDLNQALQWADNCILMKEGSVVKEGNVKEVLTTNNIRSVYGVETKLFNLSDGLSQLAFCCSPGLQQHLY